MLHNRLRRSQQQAVYIHSNSEASILSKILSTDVKIGQSITYDDFQEHVLFPAFRNFLEWGAFWVRYHHPNFAISNDKVSQITKDALISAFRESFPMTTKEFKDILLQKIKENLASAR
jgi:hypothetical protein